LIKIIERLIYPLFFLTVVAGLAYWYWTTTPSYALTQILAAVRTKDVELFEKYVDIESIADRAIDDVLHGPARESGMLGDNMIGVGMIGLFKPEITAIAKTQVLKFIESGTLAAAMGRKSAGAISTPSITIGSQSSPSTGQDTPASSGDASSSPIAALPENSMVGKYARKLKLGSSLQAYGLSLKGFKKYYVKTEGQTALVGFVFHSDKFNRNITIEIKMEENGGYWKVTELSNLNDLINTYLETKDQLESSALQIDKHKLHIIAIEHNYCKSARS